MSEKLLQQHLDFSIVILHLAVKPDKNLGADSLVFLHLFLFLFFVSFRFGFVIWLEQMILTPYAIYTLNCNSFGTTAA